MTRYIKLIAVDLVAAERLMTYFLDHEFDVTQHGTGCILKIHGQTLEVIEKHLENPDLDVLVAYPPEEK